MMISKKGIIAINKPSGWTSFDIVNKIKHILKLKRVGHLGTLDPMATGVLLVTVGKATKLFDYFQNKKKTYIAKFEFGYETDSLDSIGKIINQTGNVPNLENIKLILNNFIGCIEQVPPKFSAKNINGKRAYTLARKNVDFELPKKIVQIFDIKILNYSNNILTLNIECGSGTYIRSLGRDIAYKLNSYATMIELVREKIDNINLENCVDINTLNENNISNYIIKLKDIINIPKLEIDKENIFKLLNGQIINLNLPDGLYSLNDSEDIVTLIKVKNNSAKMSIFLD